MAIDVKKKEDVQFSKLYEQLNSEQRRAVDEIEGPVMVLAGPGTGKTQVLAMRIANILKQTQMDPWNILCLTFTESATVMMRQRLVSIIGEAAYYVRISTFHAFCNDVMQEFPEKFVTAGVAVSDMESSIEWQVLSDVERIEIFRLLLDGLSGTSPLKPFGAPYLFLRDVVEGVRQLKREGVGGDEYMGMIDSVEVLIKAVGSILNDFFALKPNDRTDNVCENVFSELSRVVKGLDSELLWVTVRKKFEDYFVERDKVEDKREAGKLRTKLKNEVKQQFGKMEKHLPRQKDLLKVYVGYMEEMAKRGRYDYEDMVVRVEEKLKEDEELLAHYQEQFQYVLVDEYQDTNGAQNEIVRLLGSFYPNPNIFVVGDDKQSVFRFQGASMENLLTMYERYRESVQVITLKNNYRSQQVVLDAADGVINNNTELISKYIPEVTTSLTGMSGREGALLQCMEFDSEDDEVYGVAKSVKELIEEGVDPEEIAVLYRFNRDADDLLEALKKNGVLVRLEAGEDVLCDIKIKQLLKLLSYIAQEQKDEILADILQYDFWGLAELDVMKLLYFANNRNRLLRVLVDEKLLKEAGIVKIKPFLDVAKKIAQWRVLEKNSTLQHFFEVIINESGFLSYILKNDEKLSLLNKVTTIFNEIKQLSKGGQPLGVVDFVKHINILQENGMTLTAEPWQGREKAVRLMTVHKAKGLEFEHVFMTKLTDRHWGNIRDMNRVPLPAGIIKFDPVSGQENNEDERRLFYVALTRAKQQVYLTSARHNDSGRELIPSIFVREVSDEFMQKIEVSATENVLEKQLHNLTMVPKREAHVQEWLEGKLKGYVMSVTHLNNYLECPKLFYYRNLLRVPAAKTKHMAFGTAVHNALRDFFAQYGVKGNVPDMDYLIEKFNYHLGLEDLIESEKSDSVEFGKKVLTQYYDFYKEDLVAKTLLEYDFRPHGVHLDDLLLTGKLDKVEITGDGKKVNVVDYKTGNPDNAAKHLRSGESYRRQLVFYKLLGDLSPRFEYEVESGEIDFVQASKRTGKLVKKKFEISVDEVEELKETIKKVWGDIKELKFLEDEGCGECEYCKEKAI